MLKNIAIIALLLLLAFGGFKAYQFWKRGQDTDLYTKQLEQAGIRQQQVIRKLEIKDSLQTADYKSVRDSLKDSRKESTQYRRRLIAEQNKPVPKYTNDQLDSAFADIPKPADADTLADYMIKQWRAQFLAVLKNNFGIALVTIDKQEDTIEKGERALEKADTLLMTKDKRIVAADSLTSIRTAERDNEKDKVAHEKKKVTFWQIMTGVAAAVGIAIAVLVAGAG